MKTHARPGKVGVAFAVLAGSSLSGGCGSDDFLGMEDYQRALLFGILAVAILAQQADLYGEDPGAPVDGRDGEDGLNCWDVNGNGEGDPEEDMNGDGIFDALDCQGPQGPAGEIGAGGAPGTPGAAGELGADGLDCWDLNGNGAGDRGEDINRDGLFDALDCRGPQGPAGEDGSRGRPGRPGADGGDAPELFDIFVDDFFTKEGGPLGDLLVVTVPIDEPVLGVRDQFTGVDGVIAYRVAIPDTYEPGNDVTMRLFLYRTGVYRSDCFVFAVDGRRACRTDRAFSFQGCLSSLVLTACR